MAVSTRSLDGGAPPPSVNDDTLALLRLSWRQVTALRAGPRPRYRRFRLHETVCGSCQAVLAEVVDTHPAPVILAHVVSGDLRDRRLRRGLEYISVMPTDEDTEALLEVVCHCRQASLPVRDVLGAIRRGERRAVL